MVQTQTLLLRISRNVECGRREIMSNDLISAEKVMRCAAQEIKTNLLC